MEVNKVNVCDFVRDAVVQGDFTVFFQESETDKCLKTDFFFCVFGVV